MANRNDVTEEQPSGLVRTSILVTAETDAALRRMADEGRRPLSWEIRTALEQYVEQAESEVAA